MLQSVTHQNWYPKRGEIYYCDLGNSVGSEQNGIRPFLILSNDVGNKFAPIVSGVPVTSKKKFIEKIHVPIGKEYGLKFNSFALTEHIRSIAKERFFINGEPIPIGFVPEYKIIDIEQAISFNLGFAI